MLAINKSNKCSILDKKSVDNLLFKHEIKVMQGILESKSKYRKVVQAGIAKWVSDFQKGLIEIKSVDDLKKLIELDIALQKDEL